MFEILTYNNRLDTDAPIVINLAKTFLFYSKKLGFYCKYFCFIVTLYWQCKFYANHGTLVNRGVICQSLRKWILQTEAGKNDIKL